MSDRALSFNVKIRLLKLGVKAYVRFSRSLFVQPIEGDQLYTLACLVNVYF